MALLPTGPEPEPFVFREIRYLKRDHRLVRRALGTIAFGLVVPVAGFAAVPLWLITAACVLLGLLCVVVGSIYLVAALFVDERWTPVTGRLAVHGDGLYWDGHRLARRRALTAGFVAPGDEGQVRVRLCRTLRRRPLGFVVRDEDEGRTLLRALGLDAAQVTAAFGVASLARVHPLAAWANVAAVLSLVFAIPLCLVWGMTETAWTGVAAVLGLLSAAWVAVYLIPGRVRVGVDGVLVTWLWRRRFVRYEDLEQVRATLQPDWAEITLALRGGEDLHLPIANDRPLSFGQEEISLRVRRIEQAAEESRRMMADGAVALPPRGDRPALAWLGALRAAGSGADADHRRAPVAPDTLLRIAEDPAGPPARRVAAAAALGPALDPPARDRLRLAASTTVAPEVREVLSLAAEEATSDEVLAEALDRIAGPRA